jgi:hypothetical protein
MKVLHRCRMRAPGGRRWRWATWTGAPRAPLALPEAAEHSAGALTSSPTREGAPADLALRLITAPRKLQLLEAAGLDGGAPFTL